MFRKQFVFLTLICNANTSLADTYYRNNQEYRTSDVAKNVFGSQSGYQSTPGIDFGNIEASVSTKMDCGRIDVVTNFEAQFKKIREQAKAFVTNLDGYMAAAPMLATCYMMPQVCALIRHDHFAFAQNLNLRAQACAAIDKFIDNQAEKGAKQLEADSKRRCVEGKLNSGGDMASATSDCQNTTGMPMRDLSDGLRKKFTNGKQRVLSAMLGQVGESSSYNELASILGEIEIQSDGYWQPLWPKKMLKPYEVARNTLKETIELTCGNLASVLGPQTGMGQTIAVRIIRERLNSEDVDNLNDILEADKKLACAALGRAIGKMVVEKQASKNESIMTTALTNGALPDGLKEEYRRRAATAFETLRLAVESEQIPPLEDVRRAIRQLADASRKYNRFVGASLSGSRIKNQTQKFEDMHDCIDSESCQ